jgi:hypothetical protein
VVFSDFNIDISESVSDNTIHKEKPMKRIPNKILPALEKYSGIKAKDISAYLSRRVSPGRKRCLRLEKASQALGYDFTASDWMFNPAKIKAALCSKDTNSSAKGHPKQIAEACNES